MTAERMVPTDVLHFPIKRTTPESQPIKTPVLPEKTLTADRSANTIYLRLLDGAAQLLDSFSMAFASWSLKLTELRETSGGKTNWSVAGGPDEGRL